MPGSQKGIENLTDDAAAKKAAASSGSGGSSRSGRSKRSSSSKASENSLRDRLTECFTRVADSLEARGDAELAEIVRDDAEVMAGGLVSLTRPFKPLRGVVTLFVAVLEPLLAFGRVLRVAVGRWAERRAERAQAAQAEQEPPGASQ